MSKRNENRPGYKKTKVGWIPEEWGCQRLDDLAKRETGHTPNKKKPEYWNGGVKWVSLSDSNKLDNKAIFETSKEISEDGLANSSARYLPKGTVILLRDAAVGRSTILGDKMAVSQHFVAWICGEKLLNLYLYYHLQDRKQEFEKIAVGSTIVTIGLGHFARMSIPLPLYKEQQKIAEILSAWDLAIEQTKKLIEAKQELKKGLMQQLLTGRMRFPEFGKPVKKNGELPEGWLVKKLAYYFNERNETAPDLMLLSITADRGVISREDVLRKDTSNADKSKYKKIMPGDIGYNTMRMWQGVSAVSSLEGIVSPAYTICMQTENSHACFFGYLFKFPPIINLFHRYSQGLVDDTLNLKFHHFAQIKLLVPNKTEQIKIASIFTAIDKEIEVLSRHEVVLQKQKQGLMQKLLTGEIRIKI